MSMVSVLEMSITKDGQAKSNITTLLILTKTNDALSILALDSGVRKHSTY